jgi:hypothetical protein
LQAHLIFHKGNGRTDDEGRLLSEQWWQLEANAFTSTSCHHDQYVSSCILKFSLPQNLLQQGQLVCELRASLQWQEMTRGNPSSHMIYALEGHESLVAMC